MRSSFSRLPDFLDGVTDFAALSSARNLARALGEGICDHLQALKGKESYTDPSGAEPLPRAHGRGIKDFSKHFWGKFGR